MPNVKLSNADHKRLTILTGELTAERGEKVHLGEAVRLLLDEHEQKGKAKE